MNTKQTAPAKASESESEWQKTPYSNLIRYVPSGTYFARIKVKGKLIRRSLKTKTLSVAKLRLSDLEKDERKKATRSSALLQGKMTFGDAVAAYKRQRRNDPNIKPGTVEYDDYRIKALLESWPDLGKMDVSKIADSDCKSWSEKNAKKVSSSSHNHTVGILRRVFKVAIEAGARYDNPALAAIWVKEHTSKQIKLPESGQFEMLVKEIENSGSGFAESSAELVQFLAYGGFRKGEAANITWADCDFKRGKIILRGDPVTGLKRRRAGEFREVPMIPEMRKLLGQIQAKRPDETQTEKVMRVSECKKSIATACKKLGIARFTHHDLRHLFATRCIESGVDIPTVSRWLGHKDGGALAMKTYGHLRDEHSTTMAQKVVFAEIPSNVIPLPPPATVQNGSASPDKRAIAQAKAKYNFPWWVSKNPMEVFWGQLNEEAQIVPLEWQHRATTIGTGDSSAGFSLLCDKPREQFILVFPDGNNQLAERSGFEWQFVPGWSGSNRAAGKNQLQQTWKDLEQPSRFPRRFGRCANRGTMGNIRRFDQSSGCLSATSNRHKSNHDSDDIDGK